MSKPTLSQIVELNEGKSDYLMVIQDQRALYVRNEKVIKHFGDVEIKDLRVFVTKSPVRDQFNPKLQLFETRYEVEI